MRPTPMVMGVLARGSAISLAHLRGIVLNRSTKSLQTLIAAVNAPNDLALKLQIEGRAVIANQYSTDVPACTESNDVIVVNTRTKGIGANRNIALIHASDDIVLFGDDDMRYYAGYSSIILDAFNEIPEADLIVFNLDYRNETVENTRRQIHEVKRVRVWNSLNYGAPRMAVRLTSQRKANIWFTTLFGGGSLYGAGEDCLFMLSALRHGLKVFAYPAIIGETDLASSSWFTGYGEKFFFDKGALFQAAFGVFSLPMMLQFVMRHRDTLGKCDAFSALEYMKRGARAYERDCASFKNATNF